MRICYIDDNEEYLNSFKDNFKDVFRENDFTFMQYPNEYIGSDDVADIVMLDVEFGSEGNGLDYLDHEEIRLYPDSDSHRLYRKIHRRYFYAKRECCRVSEKAYRQGNYAQGLC